LHATADARDILADHEAVACARPDRIVARIVSDRVAQRRGRTLADRIAEEAACEQRVADAVRVEGSLVERHVVVAEPVAERRRPELGDREARADLESGRRLLVSGIAVAVSKEAEAVVVAAEDIAAEREVASEQVGLRKAQLHRLRIFGPVDRGAQLLAHAAEVALPDRQVDEEVLEARIAR